MTSQRYCAAPGCGKGLHRKQLRYCSRGCAGASRGAPDYELLIAQRRADEERRADEMVARFPEVTGEVRASKELFGRFNIEPGDKRGSIPLRPATHVATEANT